MELFRFESGGSVASSDTLLSKFEYLQRLYRDLETFTHSGYWELDTVKGIINLSAGAAIVLGIDQEESTITLGELFCLCDDESMIAFKNFFKNTDYSAINTTFVKLVDADGFTTQIVLTNFISYSSNLKGVKQGMIRNCNFE